MFPLMLTKKLELNWRECSKMSLTLTLTLKRGGPGCSKYYVLQLVNWAWPITISQWLHDYLDWFTNHVYLWCRAPLTMHTSDLPKLPPKIGQNPIVGRTIGIWHDISKYTGRLCPSLVPITKIQGLSSRN